MSSWWRGASDDGGMSRAAGRRAPVLASVGAVVAVTLVVPPAGASAMVAPPASPAVVSSAAAYAAAPAGSRATTAMAAVPSGYVCTTLRSASVTYSCVIGHSVVGRAIVAQRQGSATSTRVLVVVGQMHGEEWPGPRSVDAVRSIPTPTTASYTIWTVRTMNPDGGAVGRRRTNHGVDLNRNFPNKFKRMSDSGPRALSEPESAAMARFLTWVQPDLVVSLHGFTTAVDITGGGLRAAWGRRFSTLSRITRRALRRTVPRQHDRLVFGDVEGPRCRVHRRDAALVEGRAHLRGARPPSGDAHPVRRVGRCLPRTSTARLTQSPAHGPALLAYVLLSSPLQQQLRPQRPPVACPWHPAGTASELVQCSVPVTPGVDDVSAHHTRCSVQS